MSNKPLVSAVSGRVRSNSWGGPSKLPRRQRIARAVPSIITGSASLSMNYGTVSGNVSEGKGAVYFDSTGRFDVLNDVMIEDNTTPQALRPMCIWRRGGPSR
ncbi:MAG: hypothetical protein ACLTW9_26590 [Enterocloster sp.]